jgi:type IV pilus assembly protein PilQ
MKIQMSKLLGYCTVFFLLIFMISIFGCVPKSTVKQSSIDTEDLPKEKVIREIKAIENDKSSVVLIKGNHLLTYTSVKQPFPVGVLLYFPETNLSNIKKVYSPKSDIIDSIKSTELSGKGTTSRIEISLKKDMAYEVTREGTDLKIVFDKTKPSLIVKSDKKSAKKKSAKTMPLASLLKEVRTKKLKKSVEIIIKADGSIKDFKSFSIENPARIVFDIFNVKTPYKKEQSVKSDEDSSPDLPF